MTTTLTDPPDADADADINDLHDLLFETKDYLRRIHWWVQGFGVLTLVGMFIFLFSAFWAAYSASVDSSGFSGSSSSPSSGPSSSPSSPYMQCRNAGHSVEYCMDN
jgi:hypothetical protein